MPPEGESHGNAQHPAAVHVRNRIQELKRRQAQAEEAQGEGIPSREDDPAARAAPPDVTTRLVHRTVELARRNAELAQARLDLEYELAERERTEVALREREEFIYRLLEISPAAIYLIDLEQQQVRVFNRELISRLGYAEQTVETFRDRQIVSLIHPEDQERYQAHRRQLEALPDETPLSFEFHLRGADGRWYIMYTLETVFKRSADGRPLQILGAALDVTSRYQAEAESRRLLEENRHQMEFFQAALNQMPCGVLIVDAAGEVLLFSNEQVTRLLGTPEPSEIQIDDFERIPLIRNDGSLYSWEDGPLARCLRSGEAIYQEAISFRRPDGEEFVLSVSAAPVLDAAGRIEAGVATLEDISRRVQVEKQLQANEERFHLASQASNDAIWDWDLRSGKICWNQNMGQVFGYQEAVRDCTTYEWWLERVHPDDRDQADSTIWTAIQGGEQYWSAEYRFRKQDGSYAFVLDRGAVVYDAAGQYTRMVGAMLDVTEFKRVQQAAQEYARRLESSNRDLEDFAFVASHDLQEPLRKILAFGKMVKSQFEHGAPEKGFAHLERMQDAAVRMQNMLDGLLNYSRISSRGETFSQVDLDEVLRNVISNLEGRILDTRGVVEASPLPEVEANPLQMERLLQNLIGNALKFHRPGVPPLVRVKGESRLLARGLTSGEAAEAVVITVEDNGIGLDPIYADLIFQPFKRLHGRSQFEGSGIGLAICRKIVERHYGSITVSSEPGKGSTFTVVLPARQASIPPPWFSGNI